ncbi:MAG: GntR family transcriptional regulator [Amaricoccus sp.]
MFHPCPTRKTSTRLTFTPWLPKRPIVDAQSHLHIIPEEIYRFLPVDSESGLQPVRASHSSSGPMSKKDSLSHRVANDLRRDIVAGVLLPGNWLKTEDLAARYGVSANPVREALWRLQGEGFVVANPNQGARVRVVDDDFVRNIFEIREALEPVIVRRFCARATPADMERLKRAAAAFAEVAGRPVADFAALDAANRTFHAVIADKEINLQALETMERYAGIINATRATLPIPPTSLRQRVHQHQEIIEAIESGDVDRAVEAAAAHIRAACEDMLAQMRQVRSASSRSADAGGAAPPVRPRSSAMAGERG